MEKTKTEKTEKAKEEIKSLTFNILEEFEEVLDKHKISIPSTDRQGDEEEARIFGAEYYALEDSIISLIESFVKKQNGIA